MCAFFMFEIFSMVKSQGQFPSFFCLCHVAKVEIGYGIVILNDFFPKFANEAT
jgi:hypothetical protein